MSFTSFVRVDSLGSSRIVSLSLLLYGAVNAQSQPTVAPPTLTSIDPPGRVDPTNLSVAGIMLTGTGFAPDSAMQNPTLVFSPPGMITALSIAWNSSTSAIATFTLTAKAAGKVNVMVHNAYGDSRPFAWDTGIAGNQCLEALQSEGCVLRWEVDITGVTNSSTQTNNATTPNILTRLSYQYQGLGPTKKDPAVKGSAIRLLTHGIFETGYTQVPTATKVQPATAIGPASGATPTASTVCSASCITATTQQAFVAEARATVGLTFGQDGSGTFSEVGFGARGSIQDVFQSNQVIQSGGLSYIDLSSANPRNVVGLYEGVLRFRVASIGHDKIAATGKNMNASSLLVIEAGYQNNSGLAQLASNPQTNTRNRFVGRFYLYPELPGGTHTKGVIGMEYSGGIGGGPAVIQIYWGTNLNPAKLLSPTNSTSQ
jgi:hypothetical protein